MLFKLTDTLRGSGVRKGSTGRVVGVIYKRTKPKQDKPPVDRFIVVFPTARVEVPAEKGEIV